MAISTRKKTRPTRIFIDADAFVAIANRDDSNHNKAVKLAKTLDFEGISIFTSNFAFGEAVTITSQKVGLDIAVQMGRDIQDGDYVIVDVSIDQRELALVRFAKQTTKNTRFTDMVNMVLMDGLKIDTIFSFDQHYLKNGYRLLG